LHQKVNKAIIADFWLDEQYGKMQVNYYYTGYYAVQINYLNSGNTLT
jgi:hypothetical protein